MKLFFFVIIFMACNMIGALNFKLMGMFFLIF